LRHLDGARRGEGGGGQKTGGEAGQASDGAAMCHASVLTSQYALPQASIAKRAPIR